MSKSRLVDFPVFEANQGTDAWASAYVYLGRDKATGLHRFRDGDGKTELFARHRIGNYAGWHIERGNFWFEFVRSA